MSYDRVGVIGRFKPLHNGHERLLRSVCDISDHVLIGIGSSNKYDASNPFSSAESGDMVKLVLAGRSFELIDVPDLGNPPLWAAQVYRLFGGLDAFVSGNRSVDDVLREYYFLISADSIVDNMMPDICGTRVRRAMLNHEPWRHLVPDLVADYLCSNGLVERFIREFGRAGSSGEVETQDNFVVWAQKNLRFFLGS